MVDLQARLKKLLGETYGGPSLSVEEGAFVLYTWTDGPVGMTVIVRGATLEELVAQAESLSHGR